MGSWRTKVIKDGLVGAADLFQRVRQDGETSLFEVAAGKLSLVIRNLGKPTNQRRHPRSVERSAIPGIAEKVAK